MTDKPDTTHYIALRSDMIAGRRGEVVLDLICTAAPGAACRKRPADPAREEWSVDDPDLIDGECWAVEWVTEGGWEAVATDHAELGRIPVTVEYDEGVLVAPVAPHPTLPIAGERTPDMTDQPESVELVDAQYRHKLTRNIHDRAAELRDAISDIDAEFPDPATLDVHAILYAALEAADRPLERAVRVAHLEIAYLTGEMQRPQPTVRHRDAITGQYIDADEAAARPETTIRETRKP